MSLTYSEALLKDQFKVITDRLSGGTMHILSERRPDSPDEKVSSEPLVIVKLGAFPAKFKDGMLSAGPFEKTKVRMSGRATWYRTFDSRGTSVLDGSVGTEDADLIVSSCDLVKPIEFTLTSFLLRAPGAIHAAKTSITMRDGQKLVGYVAATAPSSVRNRVNDATEQLKADFREHQAFTDAGVDRYYRKVGSAFFSITEDAAGSIPADDMREYLERLGLKSTVEMVNGRH